MTGFETQPRERQADKTVNKHYVRQEAVVLGVVRRRLAARKMHLYDADLDEAYCLASDRLAHVPAIEPFLAPAASDGKLAVTCSVFSRAMEAG